MPEPIMPNPMNPIFISPSRDKVCGRRPKLFLLEHVFGDEGGSHCRRPPGVKCEMGDDFAEFVLRKAVIERALQMADQLLFAAERDQGRTSDQAAVAL